MLIDPLSVLMMLIITGVGGLIHLYSTAYMAADKHYQRFFTYLNLFIFFMLLLVMGNNLLVLFIGWEGVGLCSYLLIGYFFEKAVGGGRGQESVHRQPHRRCRRLDWNVLPVPLLRYAGFCDRAERRQGNAGSRAGFECSWRRRR